jgi:hypothetical protein
MFQAAGWILLITILAAKPSSPTTPIEIEGFKTKETCLKAGEKAKQDITRQVIKHFENVRGGDTEEGIETAKLFFIPIAICIEKDG